MSTAKCPLCGGAGFLRRDLPVSHPEFGRAVPCECKVRETQQAERAAMGLDAVDAWTFENYPGDPRALAAAREALQTRQGIWVFYSRAFGTGKTGLLMAVCNAAYRANVPSLYRSVPAMLDELRATYTHERGESFDAYLDALKNVPVLALDEFHRWYSRPASGDATDGSRSWAEEKLFQIVDHRYLRYQTRLTLIATNRQPDKGDLDPIASRFSDTLRAHLVEVQTEGDLRPLAREIERESGEWNQAAH